MSTLRGGTNSVAINGSGGAFTKITALQSTRHVVIQEDPIMDPAAGGAGYQGFQFQLLKDSYAYTYYIPAGGKFEIGLTSGVQGSGCSPVVGMKAQGTAGAFNAISATEYMQAKSLTATATKLQVLEED